MKLAQRELAKTFVQLRELMGDEDLEHLFPLAKQYADTAIMRIR